MQVEFKIVLGCKGKGGIGNMMIILYTTWRHWDRQR